MNTQELEENAKKLVQPGKGILAADESTGTMGKRLKGIGVENTEENRIGYRGAMFSAEGAEQYVSGVILYDETIRQKVDGTPVPKYLTGKGILPGIKVDAGSKKLAFSPNEEVTEGLDGLRDRLKEYYDMGARFAKWRAVINIGDARSGSEGADASSGGVSSYPTRYGIEANMHALARYAALCQEQNVVPIVEPEVIMNGAHSLERSFVVTDAVQQELYRQLHLHRVHLPGTLLKPNMVVPGYDSGESASAEKVAELTIACLKRNVPAAVPGIVFLSGGLSDEDSTEYLNVMNKMGPHPWRLSFSYGRALQQAALKAWGGKAENKGKAQKTFLHRAKMNGLATKGEYDRGLEKELAV